MKSAALKSKKNLVEGRSFLLNLLLIAIHISSFFLSVNAFFSTSSNLTQKLIFTALLAGSSVGLIILKGFYMYSYLARYLLGLILLVAGLGILNDPVGFAEILKNYFIDGSLNIGLAKLLGWEQLSLESYASNALRIAKWLGISQVLLAIMLLFYQFYKLAVWLSFGLVTVLATVAYLNYDCDSQTTFKKEITIDKSDTVEYQAFLTKSAADSNVKLLEDNANTAKFSMVQNRSCLSEFGYLGAEQHRIIGFNFNALNAFNTGVVLLFLSIILMITQFAMLPNSAQENTAFGILIWLGIVVHGILSTWFWIVFLAALILYLALNFKRFGVIFRKSNFLGLIILGGLLYGLAYYVSSYEPLSDFRSYAVGQNLNNKQHENQTNESEKIFVYRNKRTNKEVYLNDEKHNASIIWEDTNFVFIRMHDFDMSLFASDDTKTGFQPQLNVKHLEGKDDLNPFVQPIYEAYFEDLIEVRNKKTREVTSYRKADYPTHLDKDTNFVVNKYSGVPSDLNYINMSEPILDADRIFIWIVKDPSTLTSDNWATLLALNEEFSKEEYPVIALGEQNVAYWEKYSKLESHQLAYFNLPRTELMKICRSNVCLLVLNKGVVSAKYPLRGMPKYETILSKIK